jgi:hypothetical protein
MPSRERLLVDAIVERYTKPAEIYRTWRAATRPQREFARRAIEVGQGVFSFSKAALERAPMTSLNRPTGRTGASRSCG